MEETKKDKKSKRKASEVASEPAVVVPKQTASQQEEKSKNVSKEVEAGNSDSEDDLETWAEETYRVDRIPKKTRTSLLSSTPQKNNLMVNIHGEIPRMTKLDHAQLMQIRDFCQKKEIQDGVKSTDYTTRTLLISSDIKKLMSFQAESRMEEEGLSSMSKTVDLHELDNDNFFRIASFIIDQAHPNRHKDQMKESLIDWITANATFEISLSSMQGWNKWLINYDKVALKLPKSDAGELTRAYYKALQASKQPALINLGNRIAAAYDYYLRQKKIKTNEEDQGDSVNDNDDDSSSNLAFTPFEQDYLALRIKDDSKWIFDDTLRLVQRRLDLYPLAAEILSPGG